MSTMIRKHALTQREPGIYRTFPNTKITFRPLIRYSVIKMRAKKANLAVHISSAKQGSFKGISEKDKERTSPKIYCVTVTRIRGVPSFDLCFWVGRGPAALRGP